MTRKEKVQRLVNEWDTFKKQTSEDVADELGICSRTVSAWRKELKKRGTDLQFDKHTHKSDDFDIS